jgi:hypothetical protein
MNSLKKEEKPWRISTSRQEVWLIWVLNGYCCIGELPDPTGKKIVTPNQNVLVTRIFCKINVNLGSISIIFVEIFKLLRVSPRLHGAARVNIV